MKQKIQTCVKCDELTDRCEDDSFYANGVGPLCHDCFVRFDLPSEESYEDAESCNLEYRKGNF